MGNLFRVCVRCDESYESGTYRAHRQVCRPVRFNTRGYGRTVMVQEVLDAIRTGRSQSDVAREFGVTRQRVNQIVKRDARWPQEGKAA